MPYVAKFIFSILFLWSLFASAQKAIGFEIKGYISNAEGEKIYLAPTPLANAIDSAVIRNGIFTLKGRIKETDYYALMVATKAAYSWFILSNQKINFTGNADSMRQANITGTKELKDAQKLRDIIKPYFSSQSVSFDSAFAAYNRGDSVTGKKFEDLNVSVSQMINDSIAHFIKSNPTSFVSLAKLNELYKSYGIERTKKLFLSLSPKLQNHSVGRQLKYEIFEGEKLLSMNKKAIAFYQKDTSNNVVHLSDFSGKYVLIDFWASWCGPCRAENPNLKQAFSKYHSKGFEVLGVSLDNKREAWINALHKDALPWTNVSDLNGFKSKAAQLYVVTELPTNYLIDPMGKIIARNIKGDILLHKLKSIFGE